MKKKNKVVASALLSILATGTVASGVAEGADYQCKGVALKYTNDCGANGHECASYAKKHYDKNEWMKTASKAECTTIQNFAKTKAGRKYLIGIWNRAYVAAKRGKK